MRVIEANIKSIEKVKRDIYCLSFISSYLAKRCVPGQFIHVRIHSSAITLRRPFSIHSVRGNTVYILFKVKGRGTSLLSRYKRGQPIDLIAPLGRGFRVTQRSSQYRRIILLSGGIGIAPLFFLAEHLSARWGNNKRVQLIALLGEKTKNDIVCVGALKKMGVKVCIATEDGSEGFKGSVIGLLKSMLQKENNEKIKSKIYACGPKEMFYNLAGVVHSYPGIDCEISFEQFMGCGLGICLGCAIETKHGYRRVCKDGPVFNLHEIF